MTGGEERLQSVVQSAGHALALFSALGLAVPWVSMTLMLLL